ncbi:sodium/mannose cotransporter SLC5A10 [Procambarus clarkii]|uniref:sodium/mannose cotransporter SLC5A10 n=1 Tax=Procambarus clarkii TaxID=6728 RepID=UPI001E677B1B|nr:sodium/glucose cotransporter 5-like [Procambarus clarkii]
MSAEKLQITISDGASRRDDLIGDTMLSTWDIVCVAIYFALVAGVGIYSMCRPNRGTVAGYFLAGRVVWWLPVGASLFASNIGSEHFIGLAGSGAAAGIGVGAFELNAMVLLQLLGWVFLPVFIASGVSTLPEYTSKRFGGRRIRTYLAILSLILYVFTKISVNLYSGAIFIQQALKVNNLYLSIIGLLLMTALCTMLGGLAAVIYTDTLQFFIMIGGSLYLMIKAFQAVGGYTELQTKYLEAIPEKLIDNSTCGLPRIDSWRMLRDADPTVSDMPWPAFLLGQMPVSIWYWCADQMMVQRVMAARSLSHAKGGTIFAGYIKLLPLFIIILPGMVSRVLFPSEVGCIVPEECYKFCGSRVSCTNSAYPKLVLEYMPSGMRGVMLSVMLSALMSDLTSIFNSASTLFTIDIWAICRPKAKQREQLIVGRIFIVILVVFSILWIPIIEQTQGGQLYIYIQSIAAYLAPPIAAIYCLAIAWKRMNELGAFWGLMIGFVIGMARMALDFYYGEPVCHEEDYRPVIIQKFHFMYFATLLFWLTVVISIIISMITKPPESWRVIRTTFITRHDLAEREDEMELKEKARNGLLHDKPQDIDDDDEQQDGIPWYRQFFNWLLGFDNSEKAQQQEVAMNEHIAQLTNLHQENWENYLLNIMLVAIIILTLVFYTYFSINPFTTEEIYEIQRNKLHELGYDNIF